MNSPEFKVAWSQNRQEFIPENVVEVLPRDIPLHVAKLFKSLSKKLTSAKPLEIAEFLHLMALSTDDGITSYLAQHDKYIDHLDITDCDVYIADTDATGRLVGYGEFIHFDTTDPNYQPTVFMTSTEEDLRGGGLGTRRLLAMNAAALKIFGVPLHSDTFLSEAAAAAWRHLVEDGLAVPYDHEAIFFGSKIKCTRFRFSN